MQNTINNYQITNNQQPTTNNHMTILDGKKTSNDIKEEIALEVAQLIANGGKKPHLAAILVGSDGASQTYVNAKVKACQIVGFESTLIRLEETVSQEKLLAEVKKLIRTRILMD